ncbi:MAG: reverse transcriptase-like protein [Candidatus Saccharimonadales bacterium]
MWQETKHGLFKQFTFINFKEAFDFMTQVAAVSERQNHHPRWENEWNVVKIWLSTHNEQNKITDRDRSLAAAIDELVKAGEPIDKWEDDGVTTAHHTKVKLYTDGGSRGNPGPSASGYVLLDEDDKIIEDKGVYLGITTNNQAEYTALKLGLEEALKRQVNVVEVFMDSLLVVNQMKGSFKVRNRDLWPIHSAITELTRHFKQVSFNHVPRELNKLADAAVNRALDEALGITG